MIFARIFGAERCLFGARRWPLLMVRKCPPYPGRESAFFGIDTQRKRHSDRGLGSVRQHYRVRERHFRHGFQIAAVRVLKVSKVYYRRTPPHPGGWRDFAA